MNENSYASQPGFEPVSVRKWNNIFKPNLVINLLNVFVQNSNMKRHFQNEQRNVNFKRLIVSNINLN